MFKLVKLKEEYMSRSDLRSRDVLQFTDEWLSYFNRDFANEFKNRNLIISKIIYGKYFIEIYSNGFLFPKSSIIISYDGIGLHHKGIGFKLIKLKDEQ